MKFKVYIKNDQGNRYLGSFPTYEYAERCAQRSCGSKNPDHYIIVEGDDE